MELAAASLADKIETLDLWKRNGNLAYRVHRAATWMERAERDARLGLPDDQIRGAVGRANDALGDPDTQFICYWIAFNALYATDSAVFSEKTEAEAFRAYLDKVAGYDKEKAIYGAIWSRFEDAPSGLLHNRYLFADFWKHHHDVPGFEKWKLLFDKEWSNAEFAFKKRDGLPVLKALFSRLYVLRNQLVHGGATWKGSANGQQIKDGVSLLGALLPIFVNLMLDNPDDLWGKPYYPYVPA